MLTADRPTAPVVDLRTGRVFDPLHIAAIARFDAQRRAHAAARTDIAAERLSALVLVGHHLLQASRLLERTDFEARIAADLQFRAALQVVSAQLRAAAEERRAQL
ncbi:hypothetical protein [Methylobacterium nodulans]|uniref:Uncharacterized protein n=1 Tax=Methylobacterium nodulans (strain LMG 21967 / CNCM I-2342 / ORS 2060) TaxID=460265 RepID=B8IIR0_METNO|nr:hypothetical protein [Methylobacterium nodulans]ACL59937.1 hypothetical protein Mnod_5091 [Methylobacterium nodulans ORS 2060]